MLCIILQLISNHLKANHNKIRNQSEFNKERIIRPSALTQEENETGYLSDCSNWILCLSNCPSYNKLYNTEINQNQSKYSNTEAYRQKHTIKQIYLLLHFHFLLQQQH